MIDRARRRLVAAGLLLPLTARADPVAALRSGGVAVLMRHATTEPGIGDPDNFSLGDCSTQRNLSEAGRAQARRIGQWFQSRGLRPVRVRSSPWCRCLDTARLAFGEVEPWDALGSNFNRDAAADDRNTRVREALAALKPEGFEVWVTHQVNISALLSGSVAMGHAMVARARRDKPGFTLDNAGSLSFE